ncbi:MAG TPA: choice-of-anchor D domain-containing protein, partial [Polyangiaceae bacterium]|nr:choice-of-anchor D domain-containing protein [Polyangiaceae bacterium]
MNWKLGMPWSKALIAVAAAVLLAARCADAQLTFLALEQPFAAVAIGSSQSRTFTLRNSGGADAILTEISVATGAGDNPFFSVTGGSCVPGGKIASSGGTCTVIVTHAPLARGETYANLRVLYNWGDSGVSDREIMSAPFWASAWDGVLLSREPGQFLPEGRYGTQAIGTSGTLEFTLDNLTLSDVIVGPFRDEALGLAAPFALSGGTCATGVRLPPNGACTFGVSFSPTEQRYYESSFVMTYTPQNTGIPGQTLRINVFGTGVPPVGMSGAPLFDYGALSLGSVVRKVFTITNWQNEEMRFGPLSSEALAVSAPFAYVGGSCASGVLPAGGRCTLEISFSPARIAPVSDTLELR